VEEKDQNSENSLHKPIAKVKSLTPEAKPEEIIDLSAKRIRIQCMNYKIGPGWFIKCRETFYGKGSQRTFVNVLTVERKHKGGKLSTLDIPWTLVPNLHIALRRIMWSGKNLAGSKRKTNEEGVVDLSYMSSYGYDTKKFILDSKFYVRVEVREFTAANKTSLPWDVISIVKILPPLKENLDPKHFSHDIPCKFGNALEKAIREARILNGCTEEELLKEDETCLTNDFVGIEDEQMHEE